ncbi:hypothetical protein JOC85_001756 [Bacillus mesophilus]|uniref:DUF3221 domain-containing protein n=1 Tax=Bacillus mesophilus TaxID=1808955 RepID=A0A6M0Q5E0_9BACI|nr:DUF3221 domain-containing protein [Bacillus mesophilus]MBM7660984.1 hypothetical protein [Bacillus mesophilus]NEY71474.1 DUF3221 domain-containing protein [Bacillus mesophilus]
MMKRTCIGLMIGFFMFLASCAQDSTSGTNNDVKDITGYVMSVNEQIILVTEKTEGSQPNAAVYTITEETDIVSTEGEKLSKSDLSVGTQVEVWHTGVVQESFPTQATATKILVHTDEDAQRVAKGIHAAVQTLDPNLTWWVKSVEEVDSEYHVTFSELMGDTEPVVIKVDQNFQVIE